MKRDDRPGRDIHHDHRDHDGGDHDLDVLRHADGGDDRVEREDQVDRDELQRRPRQNACARPPRPRLRLVARLDLGVDLVRRLGDQEQAAADQDDVAPGDADAEEREHRLRSASSARSGRTA